MCRTDAAQPVMTNGAPHGTEEFLQSLNSVAASGGNIKQDAQPMPDSIGKIREIECSVFSGNTVIITVHVFPGNELIHY